MPDEVRVVVNLRVVLGVDGVMVVDDARIDDGENGTDAHTVGQVFAHMLRDTQVYNNAIDLLPEGEATTCSMEVTGTQAVYPCRECGWAETCDPSNAFGGCHS